MNPLGMNQSGDTSSAALNRPSSVFTENYPSSNAPFDWNFIPGTYRNDEFSNRLNTGFNIQARPDGSVMHLQNFQFNNGSEHFLQNPVQFPIIHRNIERPMCSFRYKRKTDSPPLQPVKQFISEEKMSEHLSKLHISSETPTEMENEQVREQRLYLCEEMKKFQAQNNDPVILPESLLNSITRPCTALVLWKPPESIITPSSVLAFDRNDDENENNNNSNNNNNCVNPMNVPLNEMDFEDL